MMAEAQAMARDLKKIINPKGGLIAEDRNGEIFGFSISLPDINTLLISMRGRLFPFGWATGGALRD